MSTSHLHSLNLPEDVQERLEQYVALVNKDWQADLEGFLLFGSAARGDFVVGRSNINMLFLVRQLSVELLQRGGRLHRQWGKHQFIAPLMMTSEDLQRSCHLFPLEFLQMKDSHVLLAGRDPFSEWPVDDKQLGWQCEQEIMANLLRLRQRFVEGEGRPEAIQALLILSITSVIPCLRGLDWIRRHSSTGTDRQILERLPQSLEFESTVLLEVLQMKRGLSSPGSFEWSNLYQRYLQTLELLGRRVEVMRKES
ncbi:MAG: hypothetical protein V3T42_01265 [Nitrospirales bacterium]